MDSKILTVCKFISIIGFIVIITSIAMSASSVSADQQFLIIIAELIIGSSFGLIIGLDI